MNRIVSALILAGMLVAGPARGQLYRAPDGSTVTQGQIDKAHRVLEQLRHWLRGAVEEKLDLVVVHKYSPGLPVNRWELGDDVQQELQRWRREVCSTEDASRLRALLPNDGAAHLSQALGELAGYRLGDPSSPNEGHRATAQHEIRNRLSDVFLRIDQAMRAIPAARVQSSPEGGPLGAVAEAGGAVLAASDETPTLFGETSEAFSASTVPQADGDAAVTEAREGDGAALASAATSDGKIADAKRRRLRARTRRRLRRVRRLLLRARKKAAQVGSQEETVRTVEVASGDSLGSLIRRELDAAGVETSMPLYGPNSLVERVAEASGIDNPNVIQPGQVVTIPLDLLGDPSRQGEETD